MQDDESKTKKAMSYIYTFDISQIRSFQRQPHRDSGKMNPFTTEMVIVRRIRNLKVGSDNQDVAIYGSSQTAKFAKTKLNA
jgi:hypothetical protein